MDWNNLPLNEEIPVFQLYLPEILQENLRYVVDVEETSLTKALRSGLFKEAEKIIKDNANSDLLNQGPFTSTPLALVLSSDADNKFMRHLGLAKLLVECGADVNHRVPTSHNKLSPSPMEYLIKYILDTKYTIHYETEETVEDWPCLPVQTIGLNNEPKLEGSLLMKQLLSLLDTFLEHGGNPSVRTTQNECTVYHLVLSDPEPDLELILKLCEAGGNLNTPNCHLTTPLMDLILFADYDNALYLLQKIWEKNSDICSLNSVNAKNESALWRAMLSCSPQLAIDLLHKGADSSLWASVLQEKWYYHPHIEDLHVEEQYVQKNGVSPICAPLLQNSSAYRMYSSVFIMGRHDDSFEFPKAFYVSLVNRVMAASIFPIVDNICQSSLFDSTTIHSLETQLDKLTLFNIENQIPPPLRQDIPHLLFGNLKAGLQQLCVRQIVHQMFFNKNADERKKLLTKLMDDGIKFETCKDDVIEEWDDEISSCPREEDETNKDDVIEEWDDEISSCPREEDETNKDDVIEAWEDVIKSNGDDWIFLNTITSEMITKIVSSYLKLPSALVPRFFIEIMRLQLAASLFLCERDCTLDDDSDSFEQFLLNENYVDTHSNSYSDCEDSEDDYELWFGPDGPHERDFNWARTVVPPPPFIKNVNISQGTGAEVDSDSSSSKEKLAATTDNDTEISMRRLSKVRYAELTCDDCVSNSSSSNEESDFVN